jgi:uncharacterized protein (TIGR00159 family)
MNELVARLLDGATARDVIVALIDVFIVYYVIYRVLLLIKGTRAAQMVIGLVLIAAGFFAAKHFELATVSWLLDNFINYFIIIIIVVFQYDIRRGLVRIGQNLFAFGRTYEETHVFEEVIHAALHMAKARIGALIVFEREAELSEFVETGQVVDARVSKELLVALFLPARDNELHDGAVVIRNLRVQQAGSVLPLSANPRLDKQLGTRHRAAIGITEETDAVSVVVSEERGEISLCFNGNIARDLDAQTLRKALLGLFQKQKAEADRVEAEATAAAAAAAAMSALAQADPDTLPLAGSVAPVAAGAGSDHDDDSGDDAASARASSSAPSVTDPDPDRPADDGAGLEGGTLEDEWPGSGGVKRPRPGTEVG